MEGQFLPWVFNTTWEWSDGKNNLWTPVAQATHIAAKTKNHPAFVHNINSHFTEFVIKMSALNISKKRKFVADGVFYSELNELFSRQLAQDGYAGLEVRVTAARTEIIIKATRTQDVLGEKGQRIRELTSLVQKR